jgi:hypothetical protein
MLLLGCLLAFGAAVAPRLVLIFAWIFGNRWDLVFKDNIILPLLGIIVAPYTTIMYLLVWSPAGISGFDWVWLGLGVLLDIMKWSQIARNREGIPGQQGVTPGPPPPAAQPVAEAEAAPAQSEADRLAELRDEGILTEEEYQAKMKQLEE